MKTLIAYYSWSGATKRVAEQIHRLLPDTDLFQIQVAPQDAYPTDMMATAYADERSKKTGKWPQINQAPDLSQYDQILIGGPVWTWDLASPVIAFINQIQGYQGVVRPFYTSVGNSQRYAGWFKRRAGNLKLAPGYDDAHDNLQQWIDAIK